MKQQFTWIAFSVVAGAFVVALNVPGAAQQRQVKIFDPQQGIYYADANDRTIRALPVRENIYMIVGAGANITVHLGDEGVLLVDTGSGTANEKVLSLIRQLSTKPIRYIVNTSSRPDHTGGNVAFKVPAGGAAPAAGGVGGGGGAGRGGAGGRGGVPIVAHENVLRVMASGPAGKPSPIPTDAWPTQTFHIWHEDLYFNGESIQVLYEPDGATDGDSMVYFRRSDVISAGDIFMTTTYPVIDVNNGGSINGIINGLNHLLDLTIPKEKQEGGTMVIPGHGRISDEADVVEYRDMVTIIRDRIRDAIKKGKTLQQVQSSGLTKDYDPRYGTNTGTWTTAMFVEAAYQSLSRKP